MAAPTVVIEVSLNGSSWTDVSSYTLKGRGLSFRRGRSRVLGSWDPGTLSLSFFDSTRALDPTNDAATWQLAAGQYIRVKLNGTVHWYGWIDAVDLEFVKGATIQLVITVAATDALGKLRAYGDSLACGGANESLTSAAISSTLTAISWSYGSSLGTGTRTVSNAAYQVATDLLGYLQAVTLTEGGAARLYAARDSGTLTWKANNARPYTYVGAGDYNSSYIPIFDWKVDASLDEWVNSVTFTPAAHSEYGASTTSLAIGTGSRSFTLTGSLGNTFSAGADVVATSNGTPSATMTGTVTSLSGTALVTSMASYTGSGTHADWDILVTEPADAQVVTDTQSISDYGTVRQASFGTYHYIRSAALADAYIYCAEHAWNRGRVAWVEAELAACDSTQTNNALGLDLNYALHVSQDLGQGTPSTVSEYRWIDGIEHRINGAGSHLVRFHLGRVATMDFTMVLKQPTSTISSTTRYASYIIRDGWCTAKGYIESDGTGTSGQAVKVTPTGLPAPAAYTGETGSFGYYDSGTAWYVGICYWDGTDIRFLADDATDYVGVSPSFEVASNDFISFNLHYPVA